MAVAVLILWIALLGLLHKLKRTSGFKATLFFGLMGLVALGYGFPTSYLLRSLQSGQPTVQAAWQPNNVIIMLGAGVERPETGAPEVHMFGYSRVAKAASLYRSCKATGTHCVVLVSGGDPVAAGVSEAALYAAVLQSVGVAETDLVLESQSKNTWENAKFSAQLIAAMPPSYVVLVSSATHLRRSALYAEHFGLTPDALVPADYVSVVNHSIPQAYNLLAFDLVLHEYIGVLRYRFYNAMGWNGEAVETKLKTVY